MQFRSRIFRIFAVKKIKCLLKITTFCLYLFRLHQALKIKRKFIRKSFNKILQKFNYLDNYSINKT